MSRFRKLAFVAAAVVLSGVAQAQTAAPIPLGRAALPQEVAAWDIDVRPDGLGLPPGKGSARDGEKIYLERCAACHGEFGEGAGRYPVLVGGQGTLTKDAPDKTIGSFWPFTSTVFDYVRRAMPFGDAQSLTADETYALTAYLLSMNEVVKDDFVLSRENFAAVKLPNVEAFYDDDREKTEKAFWREPCMKNCAKEAPKVTSRARALDVTPDSKTGPRVE